MEKFRRINNPDQISEYFKAEWKALLIVTVTGIFYNIGMVAGPWFEGQMAQTLADILKGTKQSHDMYRLAAAYVMIIAAVQIMRYAKRFYVRRFANNVNRSMKEILYRCLIHKSAYELQRENTGVLMTKTIADVDTCVEGMRKFTTEVFDTGVVMAAYIFMLAYYDWRLTILCCFFPPAAYWAANRLKKIVSICASEYKESSGRLNGSTLDRISSAMTYRVLGEEPGRNTAYEENLKDYEKKAVRTQLLETALQPLYQAISLTGVILIVWIGAKNINGNGTAVWNIAAFTTYLSCFAKLSVKSSKAAKLFNAVQKARVSWKRIRPYMKSIPDDEEVKKQSPGILEVRKLSRSYNGENKILDNISFSAAPGEFIAVTGAVACGKTSLGSAFLEDAQYEGSIMINGRELRDYISAERRGLIGYMGHEPELLSDTIKENITLGIEGDVLPFIKAVCMDKEISEMPDGILTKVGSGGIRLSGGQQARLALARTLYHKRPVMILDDPFSALDRNTEQEIYNNLRYLVKDSIVILLSHRLYNFPDAEKVLWMKDGSIIESTHKTLMNENSAYRNLYELQTGGYYEAE